MKIVTILLLILFFVRLLIVVVNLILKPRLPLVTRLKTEPLISILVRVDNESRRIGHILDLLRGIQYPELEIVIGTYRPSSNTARIIEHHSLRDGRVRVEEIVGLKKGWHPVNYINHVLGNSARGNYLLFIDYEVELRSGVIETTIEYMKQHRLGMVSVLPSYDINTLAEWVTYPLINALYLSLYPLRGFNLIKDPHFAVAGMHFMMFNGEVYRQFQPFEEVKNKEFMSKAIGKYFERENINIMILQGDKRVKMMGCVSWRRCFANMCNQVSSFFGGNYFLAFLYGIVCSLWFVPYIIAREWVALFWVALIIILTRILIAQIVNVSWFKSVMYSYLQDLALLGMTWVGLKHHFHKIRNSHKHNSK